LDACNEVLKRVGVISGDGTPLSSLTSSSRQNAVDVAVQVINEGIDDLYATSSVPKPNGQAEATITLATGDRDYALASGLIRLRFPLVDKTNTQFLFQYPGGYNTILLADPEQDDTGLPQYAAISPVDGELYLDRAPTAENDGRVYTYQYEKDLVLTLSTDEVPFKDVVFRAMVPVWVQLWKREKRNEFDIELYRRSVGLAAALMMQIMPRDSYNPRGC
jgi:hypothetical protein